MTPTCLAEHAAVARLALDLAAREATHLRYTWRTLYAQPIDLAWVESLQEREDISERSMHSSGVSPWKRSSVGRIRMLEPANLQPVGISHAMMLARLDQSEDLREFAIQMWMQNPIFARQGGERVKQLLSDLATAPPSRNRPYPCA